MAQDELYTLDEVAERLKISKKTLNRYIDAGKIEFCVLNAGLKRRRIRIASHSLTAFIASNSSGLTTPDRPKRTYNRSANYRKYARKKKRKSA